MPLLAKQGFIYAKAIRLGIFFPRHVVDQLMSVFNLEDTLKTYILKTSLFFCYIYMKSMHPDKCRSYVPVQWAYLIYTHLLDCLLKGKIVSIFAWFSTTMTPLLRCDDPIDLPTDKQRSCCVKRANLLVITRQLQYVLKVICLDRNIDVRQLDSLIEESKTPYLFP